MSDGKSLLDFARFIRNTPNMDIALIADLKGPVRNAGPNATLALTLLTEFSHEFWAQSKVNPDPSMFNFWEYIYCWRTDTEDPKVKIVEAKLKEIYNVKGVEIFTSKLESEPAPELKAYRHITVVLLYTS